MEKSNSLTLRLKAVHGLLIVKLLFSPFKIYYEYKVKPTLLLREQISKFVEGDFATYYISHKNINIVLASIVQ